MKLHDVPNFPLVVAAALTTVLGANPDEDVPDENATVAAVSILTFVIYGLAEEPKPEPTKLGKILMPTFVEAVLAAKNGLPECVVVLALLDAWTDLLGKRNLRAKMVANPDVN